MRTGDSVEAQSTSQATGTGSGRLPGASANLAGARPRLELPAGGGAIRGIGEKFNFSAYTGTGSLSLPLPFQTVRGGFGPKLELSYDTGLGNGPFGVGWHLGVSSITRKTDKGLPRYHDRERSDVFVFAGAEDLVPDSRSGELMRDGFMVRRYRPRVEADFSSIEWWVSQNDVTRNHWRIITRENVTHLFGLTPSTRVADPEDGTRIFQWLLEASYDDKGNAFVLTYRPEDLAGVGTLRSEQHRRRQGFAGTHVESILYGNIEKFSADPTPGPGPAGHYDSAISLVGRAGDFRTNWLFRATFDYAHVGKGEYSLDNSAWLARSDPFSTYRAGFEIRNYRLCRRILFESNIADAGDDLPGYSGITHGLFFDYAEAATDGGVISPFTKLRAVQQVHYRRTGEVSYVTADWPPLEFEYSEAAEMHFDTVPRENALDLPEGVDGSRYEWVDFNGEGIAGVFTRREGACSFAPNRWSRNAVKIGTPPNVPATGGVFPPQQPLRLQPVAALTVAALTVARAQLSDIDDDGLPEIVDYTGRTGTYYDREPDGETWVHRTMEQGPAVDVTESNVGFMDVTGDGRPDLISDRGECIWWQESLGKVGFGREVHTASKKIGEDQLPPHIFDELKQEQTIFLADMSGDGLTDIVCIKNRSVSYWPNLGYGNFGARVCMDGEPCFDRPDRFDPRRIRLMDVDGSGITDIVYLGGGEGETQRDWAFYWANQSGNGWSERRSIPFAVTHEFTSVSSTDFYGRGTGCLVRSSAALADVTQPFRVVDLTGGVKPHLLTRVRNNLGAETLLRYASSTQYYLKDLAEGRTWITRLPFPVHVVESVETRDFVGRNCFTSRYAYHHGYFDSVEREFRGFGMVEQWDTEQIGTISKESADSDNWDASSHVPPAHKKTWFHHGAWRPDKTLVEAFKAEYWQGDTRVLAPGMTGINLEDTILPEGLTGDEEREACRALRGRMLRQEIFADDDGPNALNPYELVEQNFTIRVLQRRGARRFDHGVFYVHPRETVQAHYERILPADPRVTHEMVLRVDDYGNVEESLSVGYRRRQPVSPGTVPAGRRLTGDERSVQNRTLLTFTVSAFTNVVSASNSWRTPLPAETRTFELTDQVWSRADWLAYEPMVDELATWQQMAEIPYEAVTAVNTRQRRLIEHVRTYYRPDSLTKETPSLDYLLLLGQLESRAIAGETRKLALTEGIVAAMVKPLSNADDVPPGPDQVAGAFAAGGGSGYRRMGNGWWITSGMTFFKSRHPDEASGSPIENELEFAAANFYLPVLFQDAFGNETSVVYDAPRLRIKSIKDPVGNTTGAKFDYRVLQPRLLMDANDNHTAAAFDTRGLVVATAVLGKDQVAGDFGDGLGGLPANPDLTDLQLESFFDDPVTSAPQLMGSATSRVLYDVMRFRRVRQRHLPGANPATADEEASKAAAKSPVYACILTRDYHVNDLPQSETLEDHLPCKFSYSDGFSREIQQKTRTAPAIRPGSTEPSPQRWTGSGWTLFNNKGKPVRQYEPFFTEKGADHRLPHDFEYRREEGYSPILFYDPMDRVVATLRPDHSWEKVVFNSWRQTSWDANDTVLTEPLTDPDVADFFKRLPEKDWPLIGPDSPTWNKRRIVASELRKLFPGNDAPAVWQREQEARAAAKTADHAGTPTDTHFDTLGRAFLVVTHNRLKSTGGGQGQWEDEYAHTRTNFDIEGNRRAVVDALGREVMAWDYDMISRPLRETSMDAGRRWMLPDAASQPLRRWDERKHAFRHTYDALRRPLQHWVYKPARDRETGEIRQDEDGQTVYEDCCYERFTYGEKAPDAAQRNFRGRLWKHFDTAGIVKVGGYDVKGNLLNSSRQVCYYHKVTPNWGAAEGVVTNEEIFLSSTRYDALNRPVSIITPDSREGRQGSETRPVYNLSGQLAAEDVLLEDVESASQPPARIVRHMITAIDYNAKGQRTFLQYGNAGGRRGMRSAFAYEKYTFRLSGLRTEKPGNADLYQDLQYCYDPVGNITAIKDSAQLVTYFAQQEVKPEAAYVYDAIYRLVEAKGREHAGQNLPSNAWDVHRQRKFEQVGGGVPMPSPTDLRAMRNYTQRFTYDIVGNIEQLNHSAGQQSWNRSYQYQTVTGSEAKLSNRLVSTQTGPNKEIYRYDVHGSIISMPHLPQMETDFRDQLRTTQRQRVLETPDTPSSRQERTFYIYDAAGERVRKITERDGRQISERIYLGSAEVYRSYDIRGMVDIERQTLHVSDGQRRFALIETRSKGRDDTDKQLIRCQFPNHLGSAALEVEYQPAARIISYEEYHPYGTTAYQARNTKVRAAAKRYRFTGKERDEESGFNYHSARYLACWLGRWVSADPVGVEDGVNVFCYTGCNPVIAIDPNGLNSQVPLADTELVAKPEESNSASSSETSSSSGLWMDYNGSYIHDQGAAFVNFGQGVVQGAEEMSQTAGRFLYDPVQFTVDAVTGFAKQIGAEIAWLATDPVGYGRTAYQQYSDIAYRLATDPNFLGRAAFSIAAAEVAAGTLAGASSRLATYAGETSELRQISSTLENRLGSPAAQPLGKAPDFVVSPGGTAYPVPHGAAGAIYRENALVYKGGSGGHGFNARTTTLRIMKPKPEGPYPYPKGYGSYHNATEQVVNPFTGGTIAKKDPWWHIPSK